MQNKDLNKRALESMIKCGVFDSMGYKRSSLMKGYASVLEELSTAFKNNLEGQIDLFSGPNETKNHQREVVFPDTMEYSLMELLEMEKEMTGVFISGHPLYEYDSAVAQLNGTSAKEIISAFSEEEVDKGRIKEGELLIYCGIITGVKMKTTKNNAQMAFLKVEDQGGSLEVLVFPKVYERYAELIRKGKVVAFSGKVNIKEEEDPKLICEKAIELSKDGKYSPRDLLTREGTVNNRAVSKVTEKKGRLWIKLPTKEDPRLQKIMQLLCFFSGSTDIVFYFEDNKSKLSPPGGLKADISEVLVNELKILVGENSVVVQ